MIRAKELGLLFERDRQGACQLSPVGKIPAMYRKDACNLFTSPFWRDYEGRFQRFYRFDPSQSVLQGGVFFFKNTNVIEREMCKSQLRKVLEAIWRYPMLIFRELHN